MKNHSREYGISLTYYSEANWGFEDASSRACSSIFEKFTKSLKDEIKNQGDILFSIILANKKYLTFCIIKKDKIKRPGESYSTITCYVEILDNDNLYSLARILLEKTQFFQNLKEKELFSEINNQLRIFDIKFHQEEINPPNLTNETSEVILHFIKDKFVKKEDHATSHFIPLLNLFNPADIPNITITNFSSNNIKILSNKFEKATGIKIHTATPSQLPEKYINELNKIIKKKESKIDKNLFLILSDIFSCRQESIAIYEEIDSYNKLLENFNSYFTEDEKYYLTKIHHYLEDKIGISELGSLFRLLYDREWKNIDLLNKIENTIISLSINIFDKENLHDNFIIKEIPTLSPFIINNLSKSSLRSFFFKAVYYIVKENYHTYKREEKLNTYSIITKATDNILIEDEYLKKTIRIFLSDYENILSLSAENK